jgi:hypothetical protein
VAQPFSLTRSRCDQLADPSLRQEIQDHTGSDEATSGILRSLDRFAGDSSIQRYEISPKLRSYAHRATNPVAWNVRAVRS